MNQGSIAIYNSLVKRIALSSLQGINGFFIIYYNFWKKEQFLCMVKQGVEKHIL